MSLNPWIFLVGGIVLTAMGILILSFRARYAAWQNRVIVRRGGTSWFTVNLSIAYGCVVLALGVSSVIFAVLHF